MRGNGNGNEITVRDLTAAASAPADEMGKRVVVVVWGVVGGGLVWGDNEKPS